MPDKIENKDIEFQPPVKGYSYSSSDPVTSKPPTNPNPQNPSAKKNSGKSLNTIFTLIFSVLGFLFLFFIILAILNYFNVVSLNSINPTLFGRLPKALVIEKTPPPVIPSFKKLTNQATNNQISSYIMLINEKNIPIDDPKYPEEIYGIFSGFDNNYIQIVTYSGIKNLPYNKNLQILKAGAPNKSSTSSAVTIVFLPVDKNTFLNSSDFGKILHLSITLTSPVTIQQIYLNE